MRSTTTGTKRRLTAAVAASAAVLLCLSACGGSDGADTSLGGDSADGGDLTPFNVAMVNSLSNAPFFYAKDQGYYEDAGLDVTFDTSNSGPAIVTGVVNGTYDAATAAAFPILIALGKGSPLKIYPGAANVGPGLGNSGMVVTPDSGVTGYADLAGKTVATNALTSLTTLGLKIGLTDAGVDPDSVKITALPFKAAVQAVTRDQADAAVVISPFATIAESNGLNVVADPIGENLPDGAPYNVMFTNAQTQQENADLLAAFSKASQKAVDELSGDEDLQRTVAVDLIGIEEDVAAELPLAGWATEGIDLDAFQKYADVVAEYGYTDEPRYCKRTHL